MELQNFTLIEFGRHGEKKRLERFIKPHRNHQQYYFIAAEGSKAMPRLIRKIDVDYAFEHGQARLVPAEQDHLIAGLRDPKTLGEQEQRRLEDAWHVVRHLTANDEILDAQRRGELICAAVERDSQGPGFSPSSFIDINAFVNKLSHPTPNEECCVLASFIWSKIEDAGRNLLLDHRAETELRRTTLATHFNKLIASPLFEDHLLSNLTLRDFVREMTQRPARSENSLHVNRLVIEEVFPLDLAKFGKVPSRGTIYNHLRRFWQRGGQMASLQLGYSNSSTTRKQKPRQLHKDNEAFRRDKLPRWGSPGKKGRDRGVNVTKADLRIFKRAVKDFYEGKSPRPSFEVLHDKMAAKYYPGLEEHDVPTIHQLRYHYTKACKMKRLERRDGKLAFAKKHRGVPGDQTHRCNGPGEEYQIDATVADIHLVDDTRKFVIGRPTLYLVVDTFSVMITGVHVTLETMKYSEAASAIWNAFEDKVLFCARYGVPITKADWPACGLPHSIFADRGELLGLRFDEMVRILNIRLRNAPAYRADLKGLVERHFKTLHERQIDWLWGAIPDDDYDRQKVGDIRKEACLTLNEFTQAVIHQVIELNKSDRKHHHLRAALQKELVPRTPNAIWSWGMSNATGALRLALPNYVRASLLEPGIAQSTPKGARFRNLMYLPQDKELREKFLFTARDEGIADHEIRYHPYSVAEIYLVSPKYGDLQRCVLTANFKHHADISWAEWQIVSEQSPTPISNFTARQETVQKTNALSDQAKRETDERTDGEGPSTKNLKPTREHEKESKGKAHQSEVAAGLANTTNPEKSPSQTGPKAPLPISSIQASEMAAALDRWFDE